MATAGCNFTCKFCQTWEISQAGPEEVFSFDIPPGLVIERAREMGAQSVAYTFVEPVVYYEYMRSVGRLAAEAGLLSLIHSNGFINPEPLSDLIPFLHAANIDLKSIDDAFYRDLCGGSLEPVLAAMKQLRAAGIHLEITNLVVPTRNDDMDRIEAMCAWIRDELGPDTPLHFWRFYPLYKLRNLPPTPVAVLERARQTAQTEGLQYVYIGNIPGHEGENTFCPACKNVVIRRTGYMVGEMHLTGGNCDFCGHRIPGVWSRDPSLLKQPAIPSGAAGLIGGCHFPLAGRLYFHDPGEAGRTGGMVYGMDLAGSALGALTAGMILAPIIGIPATLILIGFWKLLAAWVLI